MERVETVTLVTVVIMVMLVRTVQLEWQVLSRELLLRGRRSLPPYQPN